MKITSKRWFVIYMILQIVLLLIPICVVGVIDPYFHYHKPLTETFYYSLSNERSQNYGIVKHFSYDAIITGTSMTENFKTSEVDEIFGVNSIKVPFSGARYKEINDCLLKGIENNEEVKLIIRGLDCEHLCKDKDEARFDMGEYPTYLYNNNPFDDVEYIYNRDVLLQDCWRLYNKKKNGIPAGITSFDEYSNWMPKYRNFGSDTVLKDIEIFAEPEREYALTIEEKGLIKGNIEQNVLSTVKANPQIEFYYFFTPYSAAWWGQVNQQGNLRKQIDIEKYAIEMLLGYENLHLFSFNHYINITADLNNYKDVIHYGEWINSDILEYMRQGTGLLTKDNYVQYLEEEYNLYKNFDYNSLFE